MTLKCEITIKIRNREWKLYWFIVIRPIRVIVIQFHMWGNLESNDIVFNRLLLQAKQFRYSTDGGRVKEKRKKKKV